MHPYLDLFGIQIPTYGLMIATGVVLSVSLACLYVKKTGGDPLDIILLVAYGFLGGIIGAKLLFFIAARDLIEWDRFFDADYFQLIMSGGFVFYGGLIGGVGTALLAGKIHKVDSLMYLKKVAFFIPLAHGFGRVGCFLTGCCYGIPFEGEISVVFPEGSNAPAGIPLFPIQLLEAVLLFFIFISLAYLVVRMDFKYSLEAYLITYSLLRFCLEYLRYDEARGAFFGLYTSQWISIIIVIGTLMFLMTGPKNSGQKEDISNEEE